MLDELAADDTWIRSVRGIANPFGNGHSAKAIVDSFTTALNVVESEGLMAS
jgi:hypothetical protein